MKIFVGNKTLVSACGLQLMGSVITGRVKYFRVGLTRDVLFELNFGIPPVLIFQLEVYFKVDRLLIGLSASTARSIKTKHLNCALDCHEYTSRYSQ